MTAVISIFDPATTVTVPYNPATDTGGYEAPTLLASGVPARVQHIRNAIVANSPAAFTASRAYRFQIPLDAVPFYIRKGLLIRVTATPRNTDLLSLAFTVLNSAGSSQAAVRTIETVSDMAQIPLLNGAVFGGVYPGAVYPVAGP